MASYFNPHMTHTYMTHCFYRKKMYNIEANQKKETSMPPCFWAYITHTHAHVNGHLYKRKNKDWSSPKEGNQHGSMFQGIQPPLWVRWDGANVDSVGEPITKRREKPEEQDYEVPLWKYTRVLAFSKKTVRARRKKCMLALLSCNKRNWYMSPRTFAWKIHSADG